MDHKPQFRLGSKRQSQPATAGLNTNHSRNMPLSVFNAQKTTNKQNDSSILDEGGPNESIDAPGSSTGGFTDRDKQRAQQQKQQQQQKIQEKPAMPRVMPLTNSGRVAAPVGGNTFNYQMAL